MKYELIELDGKIATFENISLSVFQIKIQFHSLANIDFLKIGEWYEFDDEIYFKPFQKDGLEFYHYDLKNFNT